MSFPHRRGFRSAAENARRWRRRCGNKEYPFPHRRSGAGSGAQRRTRGDGAAGAGTKKSAMNVPLKSKSASFMSCICAFVLIAANLVACSEPRSSGELPTAQSEPSLAPASPAPDPIVEVDDEAEATEPAEPTRQVPANCPEHTTTDFAFHDPPCDTVLEDPEMLAHLVKWPLPGGAVALDVEAGLGLCHSRVTVQHRRGRRLRWNRRDAVTVRRSNRAHGDQRPHAFTVGTSVRAKTTRAH